MTKTTFEKGMLFFLATFRGIEADEETQKAWFGLLKDLTNIQFLQAVRRICRERAEIYPTTNIVAIIRNAVFNSGQRYLVSCHCGEVFNLGGFTERECPRCGRNYIKSKSIQNYFPPDEGSPFVQIAPEIDKLVGKVLEGKEENSCPHCQKPKKKSDSLCDRCIAILRREIKAEMLKNPEQGRKMVKEIQQKIPAFTIDEAME